MPVAMYTAEEVDELINLKIKPLAEAIAKLSANDPKPVEPEQPKPEEPEELPAAAQYKFINDTGGEWVNGVSKTRGMLRLEYFPGIEDKVKAGMNAMFKDGSQRKIIRAWKDWGNWLLDIAPDAEGKAPIDTTLGHPNTVKVSGVAVAPTPKPEPEPQPAPIVRPVTGWNLCINLGMGMGASGRIPGVQGTDFSWPVESEIIRAKGYGFRRLRVGGLYERFFKTLGSTEMYMGHDAKGKEYSATSVLRVGRDCYKHGSTVKWDPFHNYGSAFNKKIGSPGGLTFEQYAQACRAFILHIKSDPQAWAATYGFDLMNEWMGMDFDPIFKANQRVLDVCADILEDKMIVIEGKDYSSTVNWVRNNDGFKHLKDPRGPGFIEFSGHLYLDQDASGYYKSGDTAKAPSTPESIGLDRLKGFADWIERYGFRGNIGETIVPGDHPRLLKGLENMLHECRRRGIDVYIFGMGDWFGKTPTTVHNIEIARNKPTLDLVQKFTKGQI